ncbi:MAG: ATP-binding protein [Ignavibacteria bacterium]|nr:ATP-binding protein [Ignavibacteria bacterium]
MGKRGVRKRKVSRPRSRSFTHRCASDPKKIGTIEDFLLSVNKTARLDDGTFYRLLVATTEAVNNAMVHGNKRDPSKIVEVECHLAAQSIVVRVRDRGLGFDLNTVPNPIEDDNLLRESGRGIFLIRSMVDRVDFFFTNEGTTVEMEIDLTKTL